LRGLTMSGHVFHPGHEELHGVTVVVQDAEGRTYVGRYHERTARGILMHDVAVHDPAATPMSAADWLARQRKFGVQISQRHVMLPGDLAGGIRRLIDV